MSFDWSAVWDAMPSLLEGAKLTLFIAIIGIPLGILLGLFLGMFRAYNVLILNWLSLIYIEVIRGTPMLVQVMFIYFALPQFNFFGYSLMLDPVQAGILTIMINSSAYIAEIVRGALLSVSNGLREAGLALGLQSWKVIFFVILPVAWRRMIPPLGNQCIISLKDTSLLTVISVAELTRQAYEASSTTFKFVETWSAVAVIYLMMTISLSLLLRVTEKRIRIL